MAYETILYEVGSGIGSITLNRPDKLNSFNMQMHKEFIDALRKAERDAAVRCVVITGAGRGFCAGQDLGALGTGPISDIVRNNYNVWVSKIRTMEKPVLAAVNGVAAGAGCSLALACDLVIMSDKASFVQAFVKVGLVPDTGASYMLPRLIGYHKAMELALFGDKVSAQQAQELGLCNRIAPEAEFAQTVGEWAGRLARGPRSMGWIKRQFSRGLEQSFEDVLELEAYGQEAAAATADAKEAIQAFLEKREPNFTGR
ncbi:MAG TPA: enoyl-CoA hydratase-related protein [Symbiobacteriaceae bacterium]|nr:enoyl-CoA hydratase-related protein [Symbiobacteriaceae bacterium]